MPTIDAISLALPLADLFHRPTWSGVIGVVAIIVVLTLALLFLYYILDVLPQRRHQKPGNKR